MFESFRVWVRTRRWLPVVATAAVTAVAAGAALSTDAKSIAGSRAGCTVAPGSRIVSIDAAGHVVPRGTPGSALRYEYGKGVFSVVPPAGWRPTTATDAQLAIYGFVPRPKSGAARARWMADYSRYTRSVPPPLCQPRREVTNALISSKYWSGVIDHCNLGQCNRSEGSWIVPRFSRPTGCDVNAHHSVWTGLGGLASGTFASPGLIQSGITASGSGVPTGFWEALLQSNGRVTYDTGGSLGVPTIGHTYTSTTVYNRLSTPANFTFQLLDRTNGTRTSVTLTQVGTHRLAEFWNGRSSEFINESPALADLTPTDMMKPGSGVMHWISSLTNGVSSTTSTYTPDTVKLTSNGTSTGNLKELAHNLVSGGAFDSQWVACH